MLTFTKHLPRAGPHIMPGTQGTYPVSWHYRFHSTGRGGPSLRRHFASVSGEPLEMFVSSGFLCRKIPF